MSKSLPVCVDSLILVTQKMLKLFIGRPIYTNSRLIMRNKLQFQCHYSLSSCCNKTVTFKSGLVFNCRFWYWILVKYQLPLPCNFGNVPLASATKQKLQLPILVLFNIVTTINNKNQVSLFSCFWGEIKFKNNLTF